MTLQPKDLVRITIIKEAPDPNPNFCHKRSQTSLFFIQIHTDVPQFLFLGYLQLGLKGLTVTMRYQIKNISIFVTWTPISTLLTATTEGKIDLRFLCGIPWQLSINKEIHPRRGALDHGVTGVRRDGAQGSEENRVSCATSKTQHLAGVQPRQICRVWSLTTGITNEAKNRNTHCIISNLRGQQRQRIAGSISFPC